MLAVGTQRWPGGQLLSGNPACQHLCQSAAVTHYPVVVQVAEFECKSLHVVGLQAIVIIDDVIVDGIHSSPAGRLADQVKVIPEGKMEQM